MGRELAEQVDANRATSPLRTDRALIGRNPVCGWIFGCGQLRELGWASGIVVGGGG